MPAARFARRYRTRPFHALRRDWAVVAPPSGPSTTARSEKLQAVSGACSHSQEPIGRATAMLAQAVRLITASSPDLTVDRKAATSALPTWYEANAVRIA